MVKSFICISALFILFASFMNGEEKPLKVFVLAGQSNMVGSQGKADKLPKELQKPQKNVLFFTGKEWIPIEPGKTERKGFGPELSFAFKMSAALKEPLGIIKYSKGGTSLAKDWAISNQKSLYGKMINQVKAAQKSKKIIIIGLLWMQGERDSRNKIMAEAYAENLKKFIEKARKDLKSPKMFFVAGRVNPPPKRYTSVEMVRKAQTECKVPGYAYIDCDDLKKGKDNLHYNTEGLVEMGNKFSDAILKLAGIKKEEDKKKKSESIKEKKK